jgi:release factor glutamine methyltransferase
MTIGEALEYIRQALLSMDISDTPSLDAQEILEKATGLHRPLLLSHPDKKLSEPEKQNILEMTERLIKHEPLPYILGEWDFFGNSFIVTADVLIPRPETEMLVEKAIRWLGENSDITNAADIGTGSGCIALSILKSMQNREIYFTSVDLSYHALLIAKKNSSRMGFEKRNLLVQGDLSNPLGGFFGLVCANLPYIPTQRCKELDVAKTEPILALDGGSDGFEQYRKLFNDIQNKLLPKAMILCEIEYSQKNLALKTAKAFFPSAKIEVEDDYSGMPRILSIETQE